MSGQLLLGNLYNPVGILVDQIGNIYLNTQTTFESLLIKFSPNGDFLGQVSISTNFFDISSSVTLARLSLGGNDEVILALRPDGLILAIDPTTLTVAPFLDLRGLSIDSSAVFDVATNLVDNFSGVIQSQSSTYGDIAIRQFGNTTELYVTGLSQAQVYPFIAKIEIQNNTILDADVLMTSRADALTLTPQTPRSTRGIAVNSQGVVLTTLPIALSPSGGTTPIQPVDVPVGFLANFDPTDGVSQSEFPAIFSGIDIYSQGMTTDENGNFYVVTNGVGSATLGVPGEGAFIAISADLSQLLEAEGLGLIASSFGDVAISPVTGQALVTVNTFSVGPAQDDFLVAFPPTVAASIVSPAMSSGEPSAQNAGLDPMIIPEEITTEFASSGLRSNVLAINEAFPAVSFISSNPLLLHPEAQSLS